MVRWEEALAVWLTVSKLHPEKTIELDVRRAHILEGHLNQAEHAIALLQDVPTRQPNEIQALELMTTLLSESERHAELMDYLEAAFDAEGERSVAFLGAAMCSPRRQAHQ